MTPFQEFRLWARRAPSGERFSAGLAAATVFAVLVWILVPTNSNKGSDQSSLQFGGGLGNSQNGSGTGAAGTGATGTGATGTGATGTGATGTGSGAGATGTGSGSGTGTA